MEDTKRIRFSNMAKFMFNEDQAIIFNRLNGQWIKVPKQCYDILELCNKEGLSWSALSESLADDEDREYMKQLIKLLDSMNCLYNDDEKIIENISFAITHEGADKILDYYRASKGAFLCIQMNKRILHYGYIIKQSL